MTGSLVPGSVLLHGLWSKQGGAEIFNIISPFSFHFAEARSLEHCKSPDKGPGNRRQKFDARYGRQFFVLMHDF